MSELIRVSDALFKNKSKWSSLSDSDKELAFFIFNRYFSKTYPEKSYLLNSKSMIERLKEYIDFKGLSLNQFDKAIGTANGGRGP